MNDLSTLTLTLTAEDMATLTEALGHHRDHYERLTGKPSHAGLADYAATLLTEMARAECESVERMAAREAAP